MAPRVGLELLHKLLIPWLFLRIPHSYPKGYPGNRALRCDGLIRADIDSIHELGEREGRSQIELPAPMA